MNPVLKWIFIIITVITVLLAGGVLYNNLVANTRVTEELLSSPEGKRAEIVMLLDLPSGRQIPVNYLKEGKKVFVGADGRWWRELDGVDVTVTIRGQRLPGHAVTILDDPAYTDDVFRRLRPAVPAWIPDWLNGKLVEINLYSEPTAG